jgi:hypothetical protein
MPNLRSLGSRVWRCNGFWDVSGGCCCCSSCDFVTYRVARRQLKIPYQDIVAVEAVPSKDEKQLVTTIIMFYVDYTKI